jgi:OOP family OmpA-OmpF porin
MSEPVNSASAVPAPSIVTRDDGDRGLAGRIVPLLSLAVLGALVVQSCLTRPPPEPAVPRFDEAVAEQLANTAALAALGALPPGAATGLVMTAVNLGAVNFASGSSDIPDSALPYIDAVARALAGLPSGTHILIRGHTDSRGAADANVALSMQRAMAMRAALVARGVDDARLAVEGVGDRQPVATNATDEGRFRNRRIEFALVR